jgi:hypothetical protein
MIDKKEKGARSPLLFNGAVSISSAYAQQAPVIDTDAPARAVRIMSAALLNLAATKIFNPR